jgi:hypothetical protein
VQRCLDALYRDGAEPRHQDGRNMDDIGAYVVILAGSMLLSAVGPLMRPMMGPEGPAVQAGSTWYSEWRVVRPAAIVADLTVPVVRAEVAR